MRFAEPPILFIILIIGTWYVCDWLYRERMSILGEQVTLLEQRLTQRGNLPIDQEAIIPLPSPISLGDAHNEFLVFNENNSGWKPVPKYKDAPIDWRHVPADMEIYAEIFIRCYLRNEEQGLVVQARLIELVSEDTVLQFGPIDVSLSSCGLKDRAHFTSEPLPRGNDLQRYRLEVMADDGVEVNARGHLRYRRTLAAR